MPKKQNELIRSKVYYYGTSVGGGFFCKYKGKGLAERGFGELWLTRHAIYFRLYLTLEPFEIPVKKIVKINTGHFHAGKFSMSPILKIHWESTGDIFVAGFSVPKKLEEFVRWQQKLQGLLGSFGGKL